MSRTHPIHLPSISGSYLFAAPKTLTFGVAPKKQTLDDKRKQRVLYLQHIPAVTLQDLKPILALQQLPSVFVWHNGKQITMPMLTALATLLTQDRFVPKGFTELDLSPLKARDRYGKWAYFLYMDLKYPNPTISTATDVLVDQLDKLLLENPPLIRPHQAFLKQLFTDLTVILEHRHRCRFDRDSVYVEYEYPTGNPIPYRRRHAKGRHRGSSRPG